MDKFQGCKYLLGNFLESTYSEVRFLLNFSVVLGVLIKVIPEKFCNYKQVFFVIKEVNKFEEMLFIEVLTVRSDISQKFDFINTLVKVIFIVLNYLHANHLFCVNVIALNGF